VQGWTFFIELDALAALPHGKPVHLAAKWRDVVASPSARHVTNLVATSWIDWGRRIRSPVIPQYSALLESSRLVMNAWTTSFVASFDEQRTTGRSCLRYTGWPKKVSHCQVSSLIRITNRH